MATLICVTISPRIAGLAIVVAALATVAVVATTGASGATRGETNLGSLDRQVLTAINRYRELHHLHPLRLSAELDRSAGEHSDEMGADGYFAHDSDDGAAFWRRIEQYYPSRDDRYWSVGENLLWSSPSTDPQAALQLWMNSPEHRRNILTPRWRQIGVSAVHLASAGGTYNGLPVTIITTDFGVRH